MNGFARTASLFSGGTLTINQSSVSGRDGPTDLGGFEAVIVRKSELRLVRIVIGPGGVLTLIKFSGTVILSEEPTEIDTAIILSSEFHSVMRGEFELPPFDWGGVVPEHCVAERNVPPVTCPFGSGS